MHNLGFPSFKTSFKPDETYFSLLSTKVFFLIQYSQNKKIDDLQLDQEIIIFFINHC
jgi:hypothetical protein